MSTEADVERDIADVDLAHLDRFGELSEEWVDRMARLIERNGAIVRRTSLVATPQPAVQ